MNPPTNIEGYRKRKAGLESAQRGTNPAELLPWSKIMAYGSAVVFAASLAFGLSTNKETASQEADTADVEFVHNENGSFLTHRVEQGESIWDIAKAFQQASPELQGKDTREIVDHIVEDQGGDTLIIPDQEISLQVSDNPENPAS